MNKGYILAMRYIMSYMQGYETKGDININKIVGNIINKQYTKAI